jgi:peptidoglycan-associated lipoprotein
MINLIRISNMKKYLGTVSIGLSLILGSTGCSQKSVEKDLRDTKEPVVSSADSKLDNIPTAPVTTVAVVSGSDGQKYKKEIVENDDGTTSTVLAKITEEEAKAIMQTNVNVLQTVYFAFDKFNIRDDMISIVNHNVDIAKSSPSSSIKIEGNCDEWGTDEYNYALGLKRAKTIRDSFVSSGVSPESLMLVSYGESNPTCTDKTEACWQSNRRVDLKLID